jgi:isoquinoline 1-oxidoreductase beta subunit
MISTSSDRVDVWVGTQNADLALNYAAQVSGVKPVNVFIHNTFSGSGFGRRLGPDEVAQAVAVSKAIGKPVKLIWTREEEIRQGRYRTQAAIRFKAGFAADGTAIALDMRNSAGSSTQLPPRLDPQEHARAARSVARAGALTEYVPANVRNGPAMQGLVNTESFIDEMAHATGEDPVALRRELLAHRPDFQQVLDLLVEKGEQADASWQGAGCRRPRFD